MTKKSMIKSWKKVLSLTLSAVLLPGGPSAVFAKAGAVPAAKNVSESDAGDEKAGNVEELLSSMSLDDRISQMIIPSIRNWDGEYVTELSDFPELKEALRAHRYGGIILYDTNVTGAGQVRALVQDLQDNNLENTKTKVHIPYFMAADEEGGIVLRLSSGTRMTGSMALGATGEEAPLNAEMTGRILGEEMAAAGFNVNFAPVMDVNNNAANPVIGTRSFSDDPRMVAELGTAWQEGLSESGVIATYKHFPGHGDTAVDSHIGTPSVEKTYEQIRGTELVPFAAAVEEGAEMIMTAHITYPLIDDEMVYGDGKTKGFYPATMSKKIITDILRGDLGYTGVVVTDALEMEAIRTAGLVPGDADSAEYGANVAQKVIEAGIDILLLPLDLNCADAAAFYDEYIERIAAMVEDGTIPEERIDESVRRILKLKERYGLLDPDYLSEDREEAIELAEEVIGSDEHHEVEMEIARQAITLLKNEGETLPFTADDGNIVFLGRLAEDACTISYVINQLKEQGIIQEDVRIENLALGNSAGPEDADAKITIDYYYDPAAEEDKLHYTEELKEAVREADAVVGFTKTSNLGSLKETSEQYQGIAGAIEDVHAGGGRFVLLSDNLPYDAARYQDADAIVLAYMGSGLDVDPASGSEKNGNMGAYNANVIAAINLMFGEEIPEGTLPVRIPKISALEDGSLACTDETLYERGFGLKEF